MNTTVHYDKMVHCSHQCCNAGVALDWYNALLDNLVEDDTRTLETINAKMDADMADNDAWDAVWSGDYGHKNYALAAYCVSIGHVDCLAALRQENIIAWHADLAVYAIEANQLDCLRYIVDHMGDVVIHASDVDPSSVCAEYVYSLTNNQFPYNIPRIGPPMIVTR